MVELVSDGWSALMGTSTAAWIAGLTIIGSILGIAASVAAIYQVMRGAAPRPEKIKEATTASVHARSITAADMRPPITGRILSVPPPPASSSPPGLPNLRALCIFERGKKIKIWSGLDRDPIKQFSYRKYSGDWGGLTISQVRKGRYFASVSHSLYSEKHTIQIWDIETESIIQELTGDLYDIRYIDLSPNCDRVAAARSAGEICIWNTHTGQRTVEVNFGSWNRLETLQFSLDSRYLIVSGQTWSEQIGPSIHIYDSVSGDDVRTLFPKTTPTRIHLSEDNRILTFDAHLGPFRQFDISNSRTEEIELDIFKQSSWKHAIIPSESAMHFIEKGLFSSDYETINNIDNSSVAFRYSRADIEDWAEPFFLTGGNHLVLPLKDRMGFRAWQRLRSQPVGEIQFHASAKNLTFFCL